MPDTIMNNAVEHFRHMLSQDIPPSKAMAHVVQRYGVNADALARRIQGLVARPEATREALAEARPYLTGERFYEYDDGLELAEVLRKLYNAVTGEDL